MKPRSPWSHLLAVLAFLVLAVLLGALAFNRRFEDDLRDLLAEEGLRTARVVARDFVGRADLAEEVRQIAILGDARITLLDPKGQVIADSRGVAESMDNHLERPEIRAAMESGHGVAERLSSTLGEPMLYAAVAVRDSEGKLTGFVRLALGMRQVHDLAGGLTRTIWSAAIVVILFAVLSAWFIVELRFHARRGIAPHADKPSHQGS